ncbi:helix-turn-helix transcriptional regulator [Nitrosococcus wardiae]|nr:AlpA family phage regulatory protein [Nitrosococcus wardiae]
MSNKKLTYCGLDCEIDPARKVLLAPELRKAIGGIHESTLWRWMKQGKVPSPIILPSGKKAWLVDEVDAWLKSLPRG